MAADRVLNRANWSSLQAAQVLLQLLVKAFLPQGPLVIGGDDTLERRRGARIKAKGINRDPVRSSDTQFVKTRGLRWLCLMLLVPVPLAGRLWALPFLTALAPSERYQKQRARQRRRHKTLVDWMKAHRKRAVEPRVVEIATDTAIWYHTGKVPVPLRWVLVRDSQGEFSPLSLLCTDTEVEAMQIVQWFVSRWQVEVTFHEVRQHLGVETQRQWSNLASARTTPVLLGLFSLVTLLAQRLVDQRAPEVQGSGVRQSAWYQKEKATFADALAWVRRHIWCHAQTHAQETFCTSHFKREKQKLQHALWNQMTDLLCYSA